MLLTGKWMEVEIIMLSKVTQAQKVKSCIISFICGNQTCKINAHVNIHEFMYVYVYIHILRERTRLW
jgi:hypothetical protein